MPQPAVGSTSKRVASFLACPLQRTAIVNRSISRFLFAAWVAVSATASLAAMPARIEGHGPTTVILASGLGDTLDVWGRVQPAIAQDCARTFAYTRVGYAGSSPASGPRDASTVVGELRAELERRNIHPPYVLVGHSLGGLYMQYFAREYAGEVRGLLLVDSTHWNQELPGQPARPNAYGRRVVLLYMPLIMRRELADSSRAGEQVHASLPARDLPTIVLSSTQAFRGEMPDGRFTRARLQSEIAADFPGSVHLSVEGSGHYIQHDRPEIVIDSARQLAGCAPVASSGTRRMR
jgi:pimeloyl-ACP methyl ester carboxylesterase